MYPEKDYHYKGTSVTEYPLYQKGGHLFQIGGDKQTPPINSTQHQEQGTDFDVSKFLQLQGFFPPQYGLDLLKRPIIVNTTNDLRQPNVATNDSIQAVRIQRPFIHEVENPTDKKFDVHTQRYYSYPAVEDHGKTNDIGDGLKLTKSANPEVLAVYNANVDEQGRHYLTKDQHESLVNNRIGKSYSASKKAYNDFIKKEFGIDNAWDELNPKEQAFLSDYSYNVRDGGLSTFPKLMRAFRNKDIDAIKENYKRYTNVKRDKKTNEVISKDEIGRNKYMEKRIDRLYSD